jgi:hypothetical protein
LGIARRATGKRTFAVSAAETEKQRVLTNLSDRPRTTLIGSQFSNKKVYFYFYFFFFLIFQTLPKEDSASEELSIRAVRQLAQTHLLLPEQNKDFDFPNPNGRHLHLLVKQKIPNKRYFSSLLFFTFHHFCSNLNQNAFDAVDWRPSRIGEQVHADGSSNCHVPRTKSKSRLQKVEQKKKKKRKDKPEAL